MLASAGGFRALNIRMNENIIIRRLKKSDLNTFFKLRLEALQNSPTSFLSSYEEEEAFGISLYESLFNQDRDENIIFGAFIDEKLVGSIGLYQEKKHKAKHKSNIWGMYVQPDYRGQSIGGALIEKVLLHVKSKIKCMVVCLSVEATNTPAKKLYESCGFKVWGIEPKALQINGKYYDELHMVLFVG